MPKSPCLLWLRSDLRLDDNPALQAALQCRSVIPVFIWAPDEEQPWPPGAASRWWLHHSLTSLAESFRRCGSRLIIRRGPSHSTLQSLLAECNATAVYWNRRYEPAVIARDSHLKSWLRERGTQVESFNSHLLMEPWEVTTGDGGPYKVFTPFWKACLKQLPALNPISAPATIPAPDKWPDSLSTADLGLLPTRDWADGFHDFWRPGEDGASALLQTFLAAAAGRYAEDRNFPAQPGTSRLSPHLHFGEISVRRIWSAVESLKTHVPPSTQAEGLRVFQSELGWREFAHHVLFHFPDTPDRPLRGAFEHFGWRRDAAQLRAWQRGQTGYPIVDAGMRELWKSGWMHNRVRMIVGSFLAKDLMISWREGAAWFWDTLVDADLANNTLGWQWIAGCGADAAPYFRIFNPMTQSQKFDPEGDYLRRWLPELRNLPSRWIHHPWESGEHLLADSGVTLGHDYPGPIVDHSVKRQEALDRFAEIKGR